MDLALAARLTERLTRLTEAGRVLSSKNESAIRSAISALQAVLSQMAAGQAVDAKASEAAVSEAWRLLEEDLSFNDRERAIRAALKARTPFGYCWLRDVYDDRVVFELEATGDGAASKLYQSTYAMTDAGVVTLGEPVEVRIETRYVPISTPATEADRVELTGDLVPLVEKALRSDGTVPIKVISPGWGASGYYPAEVLERDGPTVFPKGTHMYVDHPTAEEAIARPERSVRDLGAVTETAAVYQANGPAGPGLYADAKVMPAFAEHLEALAPHIGTSIRADGTIAVGEAEGRKGKIVESLVNGHSIDFVTRPGAGGQVLQLFEAARGRATPPPTPGGRTVDEKEAQQLRESNQTLTTRLTETQTQLARMQEGIVLRDARDAAAETLRGIEMPDMTRARLLESVVGNPPIKDGALDREAFIAAVKEAATAELAYIAGLSGAGAIRGMGGSTGVGASMPIEESQKALDGALVRLIGAPKAATAAAS